MMESDRTLLAAKIWGLRVDSKGGKVAKGKDRISEWLSGKARPSAENCEKLARALGLKPSDLGRRPHPKAQHRQNRQ